MNKNSEQKILNVMIIQYKPEFKKTDENISKIKKLLGDLSNYKDIDMILFPEMSLVGYMFESRDDIKPYMENFEFNTNSPTYEFVSWLSKTLNSYVLIGYPEVKDSKFYNSAALFSRQGKYLKSIQKHFLFETDHVQFNYI